MCVHACVRPDVYRSVLETKPMEHQLLWLPAVPSRRWGWGGGRGRGCLPADAMGVYSPPPAPL